MLGGSAENCILCLLRADEAQLARLVHKVLRIVLGRNALDLGRSTVDVVNCTIRVAANGTTYT